MLQIIDFSTCILTIIIIYFTNNLSTKPNKNIILETALPFGKLNDANVLKIASEYKRSNLYCCLLCTILSIPCLLINITSLNIIYLFIWIFCIVILNGLTMKKYVIRLRKLKSDNNWFYAKNHVASIDTNVSRIKNKMPISKFYFLLPLMINAIPLLVTRDFYNIAINLSGILTTAFCMLFYYIYSKKQLIVYSNNTDVNLNCNFVYKRSWSIVWLLLALTTSSYCLLISYNQSFAYALTLLFVSVTLIIIVIAHLHIRNTQNNILMLESDVVYADDDECWGAFFYSNMNDPNLFVDKRSGIGTTINMAHPKAKIISGITILITLITIIPCILLSISTDLTDINFNIADNNTITIKASIYDVTFSKDNIESVSLIESIPDNGTKTNGASTDTYAYGHFNFNGIGKCMVFTKKDAGQKILLIKLKDQSIILTGNTSEETDKIYNELK